MKSNTPQQSVRRTAARYPTVYHALVIGVVLCCGAAFSRAAAPESAPYPDALAAAAVSESNISDIRSLGLVVGNGEMNALVYSAGGDLHLRISKNDCWDTRVFTQDDPPLPLVDVAAGTATGHGDAGSWKHPYPTALPVAEVVLGAGGQTAVTGATLDLARAVATIKTAEETAEVRVLAQSNVILIHSKRPISFVGDQDLLRDKKPKPNSLPIESWVSYFPELGRDDEFNVCYDISYVTAGLRIAREAATLKHDDAFLKRIDAVIDQVPTYGTQPDPDQGGQTVIEPWLGARLNVGSDRHGTMVQGIFPAGIINGFSSAELKGLGARTINRVERSTTHANSNVTINVCRARLGLADEAIANAKMCFSAESKYSRELPNGLFYWAGHGVYITEQVAVARFVNELLLQSVDDIIRLFPAWPTATDARFSGLLAQGGFEVSAEQAHGNIGGVRIRSTVGGQARIVSPWAAGFRVAEQGSGAMVPATPAAKISSFPTVAGETYVLRPEN